TVNNDPPASDVQFHIQNNEDAAMWLQADRDGTGGSDNPFFLGTQDAGNLGFQIGMVNTNSAFQIINGNTTDATSGRIELRTMQLINNGDNRPQFSGGNSMMTLTNTSVEIYRDTNITGGLKITSVLEDNTTDQILCLSSVDTVVYRNFPSAPVYGSNVQFAQQGSTISTSSTSSWIIGTFLFVTVPEGLYYVSYSTMTALAVLPNQ